MFDDLSAFIESLKYLIWINISFVLVCGVQPQEMALREKEIGNEYFKSKDYEEALFHYNISINIHSSPEAKNNRAMSCEHNILFKDFSI